MEAGVAGTRTRFSVQPAILAGGSGAWLRPLSRQRLEHCSRPVRIVVKPGGRLCLQMRQHRAEHWFVVRGTALVTRGEKRFLLTQNRSTFVPLGVTHRLENSGKTPLEMIEVQSGGYLGEDDIVRFDDRYGRAQVSADPRPRKDTSH